MSEEKITSAVKHLLNEYDGPSFRIEKMRGDASSRQYFRVWIGEKKSLIVCYDVTVQERKENLPFFKLNLFLQKHHVPVPKVFKRDYDHGIYVQEDLGDDSLCLFLVSGSKNSRYISLKNTYLDIIKTCLFPYLEIDIKLENPQDFCSQQFDLERYLFEFNLSKKYFINGVMFSEAKTDKQRLKREALIHCLNRLFESIHRNILDPQQLVFCHRDLHSRNIHFFNGNWVLIDYQDSRIGPLYYDLCSLLCDAYTHILDQERADLTSFLRRHFNRKIEKMNISNGIEDLDLLFNYTMIQRIFKILGSFCYLYSTKEDPRYLKYIHQTSRLFEQYLMKIGEFELLSIYQSLYYES